jgi:gibberellin 20-oxidase
MDSSASPLPTSPAAKREDEREHGDSFLHSSSFLQKQSYVPRNYIWPKGDLVEAHEELREPTVDLEGFFRGDWLATKHAAMRIRAACLSHGFFQVTSHGVDSRLIKIAHDHMDHFFNLPISMKHRARKMPGKMWGYSGAHVDRFSSKLPWKETLSFSFHENDSDPVVEEFFKTTLGMDFEQTGYIYICSCYMCVNIYVCVCVCSWKLTLTINS